MKKWMQMLTGVLFGYYLLLLTWVILFKMGFSLEKLDSVRFINWTLFAESAYPDGRMNVSEVMSNILAFIPFGIYLSMLRPQWPLYGRTAVIALTSFAFEVLQYAFAVGVSDITDFIGNTLGGVVGIACYAAVVRLSKSCEKTNRLFLVLMAAGSACCTGLLLLLYVAN